MIFAGGLYALTFMAQGMVAEETGPPQEGLLRDYEHIGPVLCAAPDRKDLERQIASRYASRMIAVHEAVAREFGAEAVDRGYLTVGSCLAFHSARDRKTALSSAVARFEKSLGDWEDRYHLHH